MGLEEVTGREIMASERVGSVVTGELGCGVPYLKMDRTGCDVASLQIWIPAGSRMEIDHPGSGIAHFLEHMVFKGTASRSALEINQEAERLGGFLNAYTSYDRTVYHIDLPAENVSEGLELLADFVWRPTLAVEGFAGERDVILREMEMVRDDPENQLFESLLEAGLSRDLLRYPVIGIEDRFRELTIQDLSRFHAQQYFRARAFLLVAGDLPVDLLQKADEILGDLQFGAVEEIGKAKEGEAEKAAPIHLKKEGPWEEGRGMIIAVVQTGDPFSSLLADWVVEVLAGGESSVLNRKLRVEESLVYYVSGYTYSVGKDSLFCISWLADREYLNQVEQTIFDVLRDLISNGLNGDVLSLAKKRIRFSATEQLETVESWAGRSGESYAKFGFVPDPEEETRIIDSFGEKEFKTFLSENLDPARVMAGQLYPSNK